MFRCLCLYAGLYSFWAILAWTMSLSFMFFDVVAVTSSGYSHSADFICNGLALEGFHNFRVIHVPLHVYVLASTTSGSFMFH